MMQPCRNCGALIPANVARCPNCGAGFYNPPVPPVTFTGQGWLDTVLGLVISLIAPGVISSFLARFSNTQTIGFALPILWWVGSVVAYFSLRRRYSLFATGLLVGILFWLVCALLIGLLILGIFLICSGMK
jgi:hypothetical protein